MCTVRLTPGLAHIGRQVATVGKPLLDILPPCFVIKTFISFVVQLLVVLHKVHKSLLILVSQVDVSHVPLLYHDCDVPASPPAYVSVPSGPFVCNFFILRVFPPFLPPLPSWPPLFLCLLPFSCLSLLPPPLDICHCVPQLKFRNTVSGKLCLSYSSGLLRTHLLLNKQRLVKKNKILKYKGSQLQLNTALDNC